MKDNVLYLRGMFPIGNISESAVRDAAYLLELDADGFSAIIASLENFNGFVDKSELCRLFSMIIDADKASKIARFIDVYHERLRNTGMPIESFLGLITKWLSSEDPDGKIVPKADLATFSKRVTQALFSYPGYLRQAKAEDLSGKVGNEFQSFELICDIRPVFDQARKTIEGMLPLTWLKLVVKQVDGLPISTEAVLTEQDLDSMTDTLEKAKQKFVELKRAIRDDFLKAMPNTKLTMSNELTADSE